MTTSDTKHCQVCNQSAGNEHHVSMIARDGITKEVALRLCNSCASGLDSQDWIALDVPAAHSSQAPDGED